MISSTTQNPDDRSTLDETTALLAVPTSVPNAQAREEATLQETYTEDDDERPLPRAQIFLLCYARVMDPIVCFSIFPFVNQMILETGSVREEDVGFYSGLIVRLLPRFKVLRGTDKSFIGICIFFNPDVSVGFMGPRSGPLR